MAQYQSKIILLMAVVILICSHPTMQQQQQQQLISSIDLAALREIRNSLNDIASGGFFSTWDFTSPDPCSSFAGVVCSRDLHYSTLQPLRVTSLTLGTGLSDSPGLAGFLSPALSNLTQLTQLILCAGIVTNSIPSQLGALKNLRVISLTNNRLTGPIPTTIWTLPNLHTLDLSHNLLSGFIPPAISGLTQLKVLVLASNGLSGELPDVLPSQLLHLDLKNNRISGFLPRRMPLSLRYLSASGNRMWGPLNGLESLSELVYLDLGMNQFGGTIPPSLFRPTLSSMQLQRNNLSGGLPHTLSSSSSAMASSSYSYGQESLVDLSHNLLNGELSNILAGVESLFLNNNRLTGSVPKEYVDNVYGGSTRTLYLQHNYITRFQVDPTLPLPDHVSLCLAYNCMVPPPSLVELATCPASAGGQLSRPVYQCSQFNNGTSIG